MAHHVEHMDVDPIDSDFDKENSYHHGNVLLQASSIEKGYEEMDVSDLNMKLRYPLTPNSSPMSKSLTANYTDNKNSDLQDDFSNISRSLNSSMTKSDKQKIPLQVIPPEQFVERNLSVLPINSTVTIEGSDITVKVSGASESEEDISLPSSVSSTAAHTPEATTPTKESPKNGDSSIMRGLKSVFNMFRPSQSPIPTEEKFEQVPIISQHNNDTDVMYNPIIASTPLATHKSESCSSKRNSPLKESLIFNNDLEKELKWNEENVFFNFKEKVPVFPLHTQLFENKAKSCTNVKNKEYINTEKVLDETVDISNNTIIGEGTMNEDQTVSDSEFLDCETTFTKNDFQLHRDEENSNVNTQSHIQNSNKTIIPDISNETMTIKVENDKQKEIDSENDNVIKTENESNIDSTIIKSVYQLLHKENTSESFHHGYKTNFTSEIHQETLEIDNRTENKQDEGHNSSYLQAFNDLNKVLTNEDFTKYKIGQEFKTSENEMLDIENEMTSAALPLPDINDLSVSLGTNMDVTNRSLSEVISDVENFMNSQNDDDKESSEVKSNVTFNNILLLSPETKDCVTTVSEDNKSYNIENKILDNIDTSFSKSIEEEIKNTNLVKTQNVDSGDMNISKMKEQYSLNENETYNEEGGVELKNKTSTVSNQVKESSLIRETSQVKCNLTYNNILLCTESKDCATAVSEEIKSNNNVDQITDNIDTTSVLKCVEEEITNTNVVEKQNVDCGDMNISDIKEQHSLNENETCSEEGGVKQKNETSTFSNPVANDTKNETELADTPSVESKSKKAEEEENKDTVSISVNKEFNLEPPTKSLNQDTSFISSEITSTSVEFISKEISTHNMASNINDKPEDSLSKNVHIVNDTLLTSEQPSIQSNDIDNEIPKEKTKETINTVGSQPLFKIENDESVPVAITNEVISCSNAEIVDTELPINNTQDFLNLPIDGVFVPDNVEGNATVEILEKNEESSHTIIVKNDEPLRVEVIPNNNENFIDNGKVEVLNEQITAIENSNVDEFGNISSVISSGGSVTEVGIVADVKSQKISETQTNITLSPPSPKIISTGHYNFNFDTIDDPFATKTKIRMSPPPNTSFSKTNVLGEDSNSTRNVEEIKNDINKNRRRSQPARKRALGNTKKMSRTFDGVSSRSNVDVNINDNNKTIVPQDITHCTDSVSNISKVNNDVKDMPYNKSVSQVSPEKNYAVSEISSKSLTENVNDIDMTNEHVIEVTENKIVIDKDTKISPVPEEMEYLPSHEDTEINKYKKSEVSASPKGLKRLSPSKGETIVESDSEINIEIEPRISTEVTLAPLNEKQTLESNTECLKNVSSSEQSDYYSASTSTENIISKSVFNLPEIEDKNFNFSEKPKMCHSSSPEISTENLPATGSKITNPLAASDKVIAMEPLNGKQLNVDSSNSGDENCTIREVHTEDEDTVEGPFLEAGDYEDSAIESNKRDFIQINKVTTKKTESDEMFIDAEAFEFLMNQNNENQVADSGKESLFLKFDPLFTRKITSEGVAAALNKIKNSTPKKTLLRQQKDLMFTPGCSSLKSNPDPFSVNNSLDCIEDPNGTIKPVMAVTPAVNPVVAPRINVLTPPRNNRQSMTFTSPAMAVIDRLLSINSNNSMIDHDSSFPYSTEQSQAGLALTQLRELLAEKEVNVQQLRTESRDLKDRLDTLESQTRSLEVESETRLRRINELNERLVEKTNMNKSMAKVVEEYEKTIASLIAETEEERRSRAEERVKLIKEKDEQTTHLASMEAAFSDLHSKYEKSKQVIMNYKANEDKCKASLKEFEDSLVKMQNNYDSLKNHATTQLNHANQELEKLNRTHQAEVLKLNALIKRRDLHISSLEETLAQKTKANEELTAICDDLINKVG